MKRRVGPDRRRAAALPSARGHELKLLQPAVCACAAHVALRARARIETFIMPCDDMLSLVALRARARIETYTRLHNISHCFVALRARARIETG